MSDDVDKISTVFSRVGDLGISEKHVRCVAQIDIDEMRIQRQRIDSTLYIYQSPALR